MDSIGAIFSNWGYFAGFPIDRLYFEYQVIILSCGVLQVFLKYNCIVVHFLCYKDLKLGQAGVVHVDADLGLVVFAPRMP